MNKSTRLGRIGLFVLLTLIFVTQSSRAWCASGKFLWVGLYDNDCAASDATCPGIVQLSPRQLRKSGSPTISVGVASFDEFYGNAFDKKHNLWAMVWDINSSAYELVEFSKAQLKKLKTTPDPTPAVVITSTAISEPYGIGFDRNGNLWVGDCGSNAVHEFSKSQLGSSGDKTPALTDNSSDLDCPEFPTFDRSGNLWVSNYTPTSGTLTRFTLSELSGNQDPGVIISDDGSGSINGPGQIAFDRRGTLWVANYGGNTVVGFAKGLLTATGNPTPTVTLSSDSNNSLDGPWGLTFIGANLAIGNYDSGSIARFVPSQLKSSGAPTPKALVTSPGIPANQISQLAAGPKY